MDRYLLLQNNELERIKGHALQPYWKVIGENEQKKKKISKILLEKMVTKIDFEIQESTVLM